MVVLGRFLQEWENIIIQNNNSKILESVRFSIVQISF